MAASSTHGPFAVAASGLRGAIVELWQDKAAAVGLVIILLFVLMAVFAPLIAPYDPAAQAITARLKPPVWMARGT